MNNTYSKHFLLAALVACSLTSTFTSCRFEDDDYFDESPALRIEHAGDKVKQILTDASANGGNGWVIQYFCGSSVDNYEGFNLFARFDENGKVTIAGDHRMLRDGNANKYTESTSLYSLLQEDGLVLAFNTWNDVLTPFVDPVSPKDAPNNIYKDGEGMGGDQNFVVMSYNENEILLRGERHGGRVRLVKADRTWQEYIDDTKALKDAITSTTLPNYYVITDTDTLFFLNLRSGVAQYSENLTNPVKLDKLSLCFTPNGIHFENPDTIGGHTFQDFTLNEDRTALVNEDGTVKVFATWDYYLAQSEVIQWIDAESLSDDLKALYDALDAALTANNRNYSLARIGIGRTTNANNVLGLCVQWYTNTRKTSRNMGGLALKRSIPSAAQITITCAEDANIDNNLKARSADVQAAARALGAAMAKTYNVTPGSYFVPSTAQFVSIDGVTSFTYAE